MRWYSPGWLALIVPIGAIMVWAWRRYAKRPSLAFSQLTALKLSGARRSSQSSWPWSWLGVALGIICLVLALARPQRDCGFMYSPSQGLDIMLCLDTSGSMRNTDIAPSRMDAAKQVSQKFVQGRPGDRIGLIVFGGIALMQCPLTVDHVALNHYIDTLTIGMTRVEHTALGDGIAAAVARLTEVQGEGRVIIAVTDGRNNVGEIDPYMAARLAAKYNIRLYTIGIGAPIDAGPSATGTSTSEDLDEPCLRELATIASGQYFRATDASSLASVYQRIDKLEKRVTVQELLDYQDLYGWFALMGTLLIGLGLVLENSLCLELP